MSQRFPWRPFWSELIGTALLVLVGLSLVMVMFGSLPLLAWAQMGRSVAFGATLPGDGYSTQAALLGEVITTFTMVSLLTVFIGFRRLRPFSHATQRHQQRHQFPGGSHSAGGWRNFSLFSRNATGVELLLFDPRAYDWDDTPRPPRFSLLSL